MRLLVRPTVLFVLFLALSPTLFAQQPPLPRDTTARVDTNQLKEVVVQGSRSPFQQLPDRLVVNVAGSRFFRTAVNAFDLLRKIPGLEVSAEGGLQLSGRITPAVFVNGKPLPMSPEELQNYLSSLSPDMILSIEVISNPSAQYDAEHKAIINIRLRPDMTLGWKGTITSNVQQNEYRYVENNLLLTYKTPKLLYTARVGYTTGLKPYRYNAYQHLANKDILTTNTKTRTLHNNYNYQLGIDYNPANNHSIALLLRAYQTNRTIVAYNTLDATDATAAHTVFNTNTTNHYDPTQRNYAANLNYVANLNKVQLQVLSSIVSIRNRQSEDIQTRNTPDNELLTYWKTAMKNDVLIRAVQADLSGTVAKGKWNAGAKFVFNTTVNDLRYDTLNGEPVFVLDSGRTNYFHYDEYITAGYFSWERKWKQVNVAAGLRAEQTHSVADAVTIKERTARNYLTWLPNLQLSWTIATGKQLNLSYSRRITRPTFPQLNPFRFYFSPLNYWIGNPTLLPSTTQTVVVSYGQRAFTATLMAGREKDVSIRYPEYDSTTNILQYLGKNIPYGDFASIEVSVPITVTPWWRMTNTVGGYYRKELMPYHDVNYAIPITHFSITGSQVFTLPKGFTVDLYYFYRSNTGNSLYYIKPLSNVDLGLQKAWLKGKLNTKLNYYDIFDTYRNRLVFREKRLINNQLQHWFGIRRVALTISYSFGRSTQKAKQDSRSEEESRAGF